MDACIELACLQSASGNTATHSTNGSVSGSGSLGTIGLASTSTIGTSGDAPMVSSNPTSVGQSISAVTVNAVGTGSGTAQPPNCYVIVTLKEASRMFIHLDMHYQHSLDQRRPPRPSRTSPEHLVSPGLSVGTDSSQSISFMHQSGNRVNDASLKLRAAAAAAAAAVALERLAGQPDAPARHWLDYLARYLCLPSVGWSSTSVPISPRLCARIRPVFLYRNVKKCVDRLTRQAMHRRCRQLISTGDVQPEELAISSLATTSGISSTEQAQPSEPIADSLAPSQSDSVPLLFGAAGFERDAWELMRSVFRNELTRKEVSILWLIFYSNYTYFFICMPSIWITQFNKRWNRYNYFLGVHADITRFCYIRKNDLRREWYWINLYTTKRFEKCISFGRCH
ncbi:unnamed protein product [Protopolystoma xenopodis]|uniref:Uncharacterized protein n=1 Tax=Protopolystoma xenopodis TaxID=117903 RepID=A0A448WUX9_9PLAT|nr:unnamed protein product [Protopolystoma xenopodis]